MKDYVSEFKQKIAEIDDDTKNIYIINAGSMNHGKSSLFNSLYGSEIFKTGDFRVTVASQKEKWYENVYLIDTPGLEAEKIDDDVAYAAYRTANLIVFVHTIKVGELHKKELDAINNIKSIFYNDKFFWQHFCLVFTFLESDSPESIEAIKAKSLADIKNSCGGEDFKHFIVSNSRYKKGSEEDKNALLNKSGILELREYMKENFGRWVEENQTSMREVRIGRAKNEILSELENEKEKVKKKSEEKIQHLKDSQSDFLYRVEEAVNQFYYDESDYEYEESLLEDLKDDLLRFENDLENLENELEYLENKLQQDRARFYKEHS